MKTICIVDDTADLLTNLTGFLRMEGFSVWSFAKAEDALLRLDMDKPDLIITDLWMPEMDGLVFIEHLKSKAHLKAVPVVIFSARPVDDYEVKARLLGVTNFIKKPAQLEEILSVINPLLNISV